MSAEMCSFNVLYPRAGNHHYWHPKKSPTRWFCCGWMELNSTLAPTFRFENEMLINHFDVSTLAPVVLNRTRNIMNNIRHNSRNSRLVNTDAFTHCTTSRIWATLFSTAQCGFNFASSPRINCWNVINTHEKNNHKTPRKLIFQDHQGSYADELQRRGSAEDKAADSASGNMESV